LHVFYAADFVDTARPPTAYSRINSACHTNTTVHVSLTAWLLNLLMILMPACLTHHKPGTAVIHLCTLCTLGFHSALYSSLYR